MGLALWGYLKVVIPIGYVRILEYTLVFYVGVVLWGRGFTPLSREYTPMPYVFVSNTENSSCHLLCKTATLSFKWLVLPRNQLILILELIENQQEFYPLLLRLKAVKSYAD